ncbi:hypothetical protein PUN28_001607 [Cardiocondyla obscurior]|uniref:Secreted protein n=1 Tax=Cardiocondyla obscurior TaxID=286306 RepID=A0AAW2GQC5_9HYME
MHFFPTNLPIAVLVIPLVLSLRIHTGCAHVYTRACAYPRSRVRDLINFEYLIDFLRNSRAIHCAFSSLLLSGQRRLRSMHNISNIDRCARSRMHAYPKEVPRKPLCADL